MKLTIQERYTAIRLLPTKSSFSTMEGIKKAEGMLYPSEAEVKKMSIKDVVINNKNQVQWDTKEGSKEVDIPLGEIVCALIKLKLESLDKDELLERNHSSLYVKFVKGL